jgi:hypothetical protein
MTTLKVYSRWAGIPEVAFPDLLKYNSNFSRTTTIGSADIILVPYAEVFDEYSHSRFRDFTKLNSEQSDFARAEFARLLDEVRNSGLPSVLCRHSDFEHLERFQRGFTFQTTLSKRTKRETDFSLPGFIAADIEKAAAESTALAFPLYRPTIGFRGSARPARLSVQRAVRDAAAVVQRFGIGRGSNVPAGLSGLVQRAAWDEGQLLRARVLEVLRRSPEIDTDFSAVLRGYIGASRRAKTRNRATFLKCLIDNQYSFCARGRGNFSYRFYETLAMRRIPLLLDTDCVLPFEDRIEWEDVILRVDSKDLEDLPDLLTSFHRINTPARLVTIQNRANELWCRNLKPQTFWAHAGQLVTERL